MGHLAISDRDPVPPLAQRIGDRVRDLRRARGYSQIHLADFAMLHRTFIGRVERGETNVTVATLERICAALNITLQDFFRAFDGDKSDR